VSERPGDLGLVGRVAVLTGAANGLGATTARWLAERGVAVALLDIDQDANEELADQLAGSGGDALAVSCDVSEPAEVASAAMLCGAVIESAQGVVTAWEAALCGSLPAIHRFQSAAGTVRVICTSLRGSTR